MNNIIKYFQPKEEAIYFNQLKAHFFIRLSFAALLLIAIYMVSDFFVKNDNFVISISSKAASFIFLLLALFVLKHKGIKVAGNMFTTTGLVIILIFLNILNKNIEPTFKFIQGFYSVFAYLILGVLFATRPFVLLNACLILISTTHVLVRAINYYPEFSNLYISSYINHTVIVLLGTTIVYYANKLIMLAINKADEEVKLKEQKNQELLTSEEEIRASNEELLATTNALVDANKDIEEALIKATESDRLKTEFLNNMSHEVRTPMNGIIGFAQLLNIPDLDEAMLNNYTNLIQQSTKQLLLIIDNIIEISKLGTKQVPVVETLVYLNKLMDELFAVFSVEASDKGIILGTKKDLDNESCLVICDENKLHKILNNLLDNAIKFTDAGSIIFGYELVKDNAIEQNEIIKFFVKDTGIGIEKEKQQLIFDKFSQGDAELSRQYGGLGLGLAIAKENTELLGGRISVHSEPSQGATFTVELSVKKP